MKANRFNRVLGLVVLACLTLVAGCDESEAPTKNLNFYMFNNIERAIRDVSFIDDLNGVICGNFGYVAKTTDGGKTFTQLDAGITDGTTCSYMISPIVFGVGAGGLYQTKDGGAKFNELGNFSSTTSSLTDAYFFDEHNGIIVHGHAPYKTSDGGLTWYQTGATTYIDKLQFTSSTIGYMGGGESHDGMSAGVMNKTIDGGETWQNLFANEKAVLAFYFINDTIGYFTSYQKEFFRTTDGGYTWDKLSNIPVGHYTLDMLFLNEDEGYLVTDMGILLTTDGGLSWELIYDGYEERLNSIAKTPNHLYVTGATGVVLKKDL